jgi:GR25 family glycosyltransferase involved in LPS biosynthesis
MNQYFDKIYCINLDRRSDRWSICLNEFKKHNLTVERFPAVDGKKITAKSDWMTGGRIACCLSHLGIIKQMISQNIQKVLILEDDVQFIDNLNEVFSEKINAVPNDFDMLYFCGNSPRDIQVLNPHVAKISKTLSTGSYAISINFAKLIATKIEELNVAVDSVYWDNTPYCNCYIFMPFLSTQRASFSDIEEKFTDYSSCLKF